MQGCLLKHLKMNVLVTSLKHLVEKYIYAYIVFPLVTVGMEKESVKVGDRISKQEVDQRRRRGR